MEASQESPSNNLIFDPLSLSFTENPHPIYKAFREQQPVAWLENYQAWLITRHDDFKLVTSDSRFTVDKRIWKNFNADAVSTLAPTRNFIINNSPLMDEGDMHMAARRILPKTFSPRALERAQTMIDAVVAENFAPLKKGMEVDLVKMVQPIPNTVMARLLCIDELDVSETDFIAIARQFLKCINPFMPDEELVDVEKAAVTVMDMFRQLIAMRREQPGDDIVSCLLAAADDDEKEITEENILSLLASIMIVGSDTTVYQALLILKDLLDNPEMIQQIKQQPNAMEGFYQESLRYNSVGKMLVRYPREDLELRGQPMQRGDMIMVPVAAANRDPAVFENPDTFDISRNQNPSMPFGHGIHYCLGAHVARAEIIPMMRQLVEQLGDDYRYDPDSVQWRAENFSVREISLLPLTP